MSHADPARVDAPEPEAPTDPVEETPTDPTTDGASAADALPQLVELPDEAPEPTLDTAPERSIAAQAARTDQALSAWRDESTRRSEQWQADQATLEVEGNQRRWHLTAAMILGATAAVLLLVLATVFATVAAPIAYLAAAPPADPAPVEVVVAEAAPDLVVEAPVVAPPVDAPSVDASAVAEPTVVVEPEVAEVAPDGTTPVEPAVGSPPVQAVKVVTIDGWVWTEFLTSSTGPVTMRWRDGANAPVLEPMGCGGPMKKGLRRCEAGRSQLRIGNALAAGATPGTWSVEACLGAACAPLGTFVVPLP